MTARQFVEALETIGWSKRQLAIILACDTNLPTRWARGDAVVPVSIGRWLNALADAHRVLPSPQAWRVHPVATAAKGPASRPARAARTPPPGSRAAPG